MGSERFSTEDIAKACTATLNGQVEAAVRSLMAKGLDDAVVKFLEKAATVPDEAVELPNDLLVRSPYGDLWIIKGLAPGEAFAGAAPYASLRSLRELGRGLDKMRQEEDDPYV